jgi:hypothetical protein
LNSRHCLTLVAVVVSHLLLRRSTFDLLLHKFTANCFVDATVVDSVITVPL